MRGLPVPLAFGQGNRARRSEAMPVASAARFCVYCMREVDAWLPYYIREADISPFLKRVKSIGSNVERFLCPHCSSFDRERHLRLFVDRLDILKSVPGGSVLHMSPEVHFGAYVERRAPRSYIKGDLSPQTEGVLRVDLQCIPFPSASFDLLICNHVLEHVDDAAAAMREMHRVLKPGGRAICQTPYAARLSSTFTDPLLQSTEDRLFFYAQDDHVRLFGADIV